MKKDKPPYTKIIKGECGMYWGFIYVNGKQFEKVGGYSGFVDELNCISFLNQRIDFHNETKNLNIPRYVKEQKNETT